MAKRLSFFKFILLLSFGGILLTGCKSSSANLLKTFTVNGATFSMVEVKGGSFEMGAVVGSSVAEEDEYPVHNVTLDDFYIGETEVTRELWSAVMGSDPSGMQGTKQAPVESVNWNDCNNFLNKLNELTGVKFTLPTEAQWEYAARGGKKSKGYLYSGSNNIDDVAWHSGNANNNVNDVKKKAPNELGIYDMSGNVSEWCSDWYGEYAADDVCNPVGASSGHSRVVRGGCWINEESICRVTDRTLGAPRGSGCILGLRLCLTK